MWFFVSLQIPRAITIKVDGGMRHLLPLDVAGFLLSSFLDKMKVSSLLWIIFPVVKFGSSKFAM